MKWNCWWKGTPVKKHYKKGLQISPGGLIFCCSKKIMTNLGQMKQIFQYFFTSSYGNIIPFVSGIFLSNNIIIFENNCHCVSVWMCCWPGSRTLKFEFNVCRESADIEAICQRKVMTIRKKSEIFHLNYSSGLEGLPKGYQDYLFNRKKRMLSGRKMILKLWIWFNLRLCIFKMENQFA